MASQTPVAANEFEPTTSQPGPTGQPAGQPAGSPTGAHDVLARRQAPLWSRVFPLFTSAIFFMSGIFAVFAPIPLLFLNFRSGRAWAFFAILVNCAIVYFAGGSVSLAAYAVFVVALVAVLPELLRAKTSVEGAVGLTLVSMVIVAAVVLGWFAHVHHVNPLAEVRNQLSEAVDYLGKNAPQGTLSAPGEIDDWKQSVLVEFPSAIAVFALVMIWANLVVVLRLNPDGIREKMGLDVSYFKKWRSPAWLVWPTIATGVFLVIDAGRVSDVSLNIFKFLMAIYTIHGLSILSFFFDLWNVRGFLRTVGFLVSIFVMMPLLLSLGFFDLWFDFRAKFKAN